MRAKPLPPPFSEGPFTVRDALAAGMPRNRLRAADLHRGLWGVRTTEAAETLHARCAALATRLDRRAFFSHDTAVALLGAPLPRGHRDTRLHVSFPTGHRAPHARGIAGHQIRLIDSDIVELDGLRVSAPERTWCDMAARVPLADLVAIGDHLIHHTRKLASAGSIGSRWNEYVGRRGRANALAAFPLIVDRSESHPESVLRVHFVLNGLPEATANHEMVRTDTGSRLRTDLAFRRWKVVVEYQGDYHRTAKDQWRKDMRRRSWLEAQGWIVIELNALDLDDPAGVLVRVGAALRRHGWTPTS